MNDQEVWLVEENGTKIFLGSYPEKEGRLLLEDKATGIKTYWRGNGLFNETRTGRISLERTSAWMDPRI